ncbi:MAG: 16S rRNA (adenine(1518)-N(6)/adenine(1519)-N(6))-dimethyltransferase RsmA [Alphaproteobacteria bacterium]|nr:16S rRNA (adenine(1518)-N(6)/adenine(1519)-N(6))-dimethyltransferase RsmA [Alphaproteobacteria bacterium]
MRAQFLNTNNFSTKRSLGQHFLVDQNVVRGIINSIPKITDSIFIEIGPGQGVLTKALLNAGAPKIYVIEKDDRLIADLEQLACQFNNRLVVIHQDALKFDYKSIGSDSIQIVSNLPYNIGTELLISWLHQIHMYKALTLMFQKEVADRIIASPRTKSYGRLSIISQLLCTCKKIIDIPPSAFSPAPQVYSSIVQFIPNYTAQKISLLGVIEKITAAGFGNRRKMLRQSLKGVNSNVLEWLKNSGIDEMKRAEDLTVEEYVTLAQKLSDR